MFTLRTNHFGTATETKPLESEAYEPIQAFKDRFDSETSIIKPVKKREYSNCELISKYCESLLDAVPIGKIELKIPFMGRSSFSTKLTYYCGALLMLGFIVISLVAMADFGKIRGVSSHRVPYQTN